MNSDLRLRASNSRARRRLGGDDDARTKRFKSRA